MRGNWNERQKNDRVLSKERKNQSWIPSLRADFMHCLVSTALYAYKDRIMLLVVLEKVIASSSGVFICVKSKEGNTC